MSDILKGPTKARKEVVQVGLHPQLPRRARREAAGMTRGTRTSSVSLCLDPPLACLGLTQKHKSEGKSWKKTEREIDPKEDSTQK